MPQDTYTFDAQQAIRQIDRLTQQFRELAEAQGIVAKTTSKLNAEGEALSHTYDVWIDDNRKLVVSFRDTGEGLEFVGQKLVDTTGKINQQIEAQRRLAATQRQFAVQAKQFTAGLTASSRGARADSTLQEQLNFRNAQAALRDYVTQNEISGAKINQVWKRVQNGALNDVIGKERELQNILVRLKTTYDRLGESARRNRSAEQAKREADARRRAAAAAREQRRAVAEAAKAQQQLTLSWRTMSRLIVSSLASRAISSFTSQIYQAVDATIELGKAVSEIQTIDDLDTSFENLTDQLRELSDAYGLDIVDQAQAAYQALSNQVVDTAEVFEFLDTANRLALAGVATTEQSVNLLSSAINAFNLDVSDADRVASVLFRTVELGRIKVEDIADTFGRVAVPAGQLNVSLEETAAALANLTIQGIKPREAITQLNGVFTKLVKPTTALKGLLQELGFESGEAAISVLGLSGFLDEIAKKSGGSSTELAKFINRARGLRGVMTLAADGVSEFEQTLQALENSTAEFDEATAKVLATDAKQLQIEINKIRNIFLDLVQDGLRAVDRFFGGFGGLSSAVEQLANVFEFTLVPAIALATAAFVKLGAASIAAAIANPWITLAAVIAGATAALVIFAGELDGVGEANLRAAQAGRDEYLANVKAQAAAERARATEFEELLKEQERLTALAGRSIRQEYKRTTDEINRYFEENEETIKAAFDSITKSLKENVSEIDSEIQDLEKSIDRVVSTVKTANQSLRELQFEDQLDQIEDPREQIEAINRELVRLQDIQAIAARAGVEETFRDTTRRIVELVKQLKKAEDDLTRDNEQNAKKRADIARKAAEARRESLNKVRDLQTDLERTESRDPADLEKRNELQNKISEELLEQSLREDEFTRKLAEARIYEFERSNINETINQQVQTNIDLQDELNRKLTEQIELLNEAKKVAAADLALFQTNLAKFTPGDLTDILEADTFEEVDRIARGSIAVLNELLAALNKQPDNEGTAERIRLINDLIDKTREAGYERGRLLALEEQEGRQRDRQRALRAEFNQNAQINAELEKRIKQVTTITNQILNLQGFQFLGGIQEFTESRADPDVVKAYRILGEVFEGNLVLAEELDEALGDDQQAYSEVADAARRLRNSLAVLQTGKTDLESVNNALTSSAEILNAIPEDALKNLSQPTRDFLTLLRELQTQLSADTLGVAYEEIGERLAETQGARDQFIEDLGLIVGAQQGLVTQQQETIKSNDLVTASIERMNTALTQYGQTLGTLAVEAPAPQARANGGQIGSDSVHAMLAPGEFVVPANAAKKFRTQLLSMTSGVRRFENGGSVTNISGDFNISAGGSGDANTDVIAIGKGLQRAIRRGLLRSF